MRRVLPLLLLVVFVFPQLPVVAVVGDSVFAHASLPRGAEFSWPRGLVCVRHAVSGAPLRPALCFASLSAPRALSIRSYIV